MILATRGGSDRWRLPSAVYPPCVSMAGLRVVTPATVGGEGGGRAGDMSRVRGIAYGERDRFPLSILIGLSAGVSRL